MILILLQGLVLVFFPLQHLHDGAHVTTTRYVIGAVGANSTVYRQQTTATAGSLDKERRRKSIVS